MLVAIVGGKYAAVRRKTKIQSLDTSNYEISVDSKADMSSVAETVDPGSILGRVRPGQLVLTSLFAMRTIVAGVQRLVNLYQYIGPGEASYLF